MINNILKSKMYVKLIITNSLIIIFILSTLGFYSINKIKNSVKEDQLYLNKKIIEDINEFLDYQNTYAKNIINSLYTDANYLNDVIKYMNSPIQEYLAFKLDNYLESNKEIYRGVDYMIKDAFQGNDSISNISMYSKKSGQLNIFRRSDMRDQYCIDTKKYDENTPIEVFIEDSISESNEGELNIYLNLNDSNNLEHLGILIVTVNTKEIDNIIAKYGKVSSDITLIDNEEKILYDSKYDRVGEVYPYDTNLMMSDYVVMLDTLAYVDMNVNKSGIVIVGSINEESIKTLTFKFRVTIILGCLFLFGLAEIFLVLRFNNFEKRTNGLLRAMEAVKEGKLEVRVSVTKETDEINLIAENFNEMCSKLDSHIKRSYIAEIKQKKAECTSLQNQINPHFLYNILESIRMKAICNGDKDVGRALYNLAAIFRAQVKGNSNISIYQEINYTKMYLELYKFRYEDKLNFKFSYDDEILNKEILKFSIQPLVENYLVHGFDIDREDNLLEVRLSERDESIEIKIIDNGKGIEEEKLLEIKGRIKKCEYDGKSIGLINVHERIKLTYGDEYGILIEKAVNSGTVVTVKIPCKGVGKNV